MKLYRAQDAVRLINGVFCVYKPSGMTMKDMRTVILSRLAEDLNSLEVRPCALRLHDVVREDPVSGELAVVAKQIRKDYSDHPLVIGDRYIPEDFQLEWLQEFDDDTAGVCPAGINDGCDILKQIHNARLLRSYRIEGRFGKSSLDYSARGKIIERTCCNHLTQHRINKFLAKVSTTYQQQAFQFAGVQMDSQAAFELASRGLVRPKEDSHPIYYDLRCIRWKKPQFELEVACVNEQDWYIKKFVCDIGIGLKTGAVYSRIRRIRYGYFDLDVSLLPKHWTLQNIINNIIVCKQLIANDKLETAGQKRNRLLLQNSTFALTRPSSSTNCQKITDNQENLFDSDSAELGTEPADAANPNMQIDSTHSFQGKIDAEEELEEDPECDDEDDGMMNDDWLEKEEALPISREYEVSRNN